MLFVFALALYQMNVYFIWLALHYSVQMIWPTLHMQKFESFVYCTIIPFLNVQIASGDKKKTEIMNGIWFDLVHWSE